MISFSQPLTEIKGIGPRIALKLAKLKIRTVKELLYYFPFRYQDFSQIKKIAQLSEGEVATVYGKITEVKLYRTWKKKMWIVEALIDDNTGKLKAVWFNQKFLIRSLKKGLSGNFSGKITFEGKKPLMQNPVFEILSNEFQETKHTARLVPIYPQTVGVTSKMIRFVISKVIPLLEEVKEFLPEKIIQELNLPPLKKAFVDIHFPKTLTEAQKAIQRFSFQDLFLLQLINASEKHQLLSKKAYSCPYQIEQIKKIISSLPFELTLSQKKALYEILEDLKKDYPTSRLLQGDVGSGKTIVAAIAALIVAQNQKQTVFMAPTEVLASQHYQTFKKFFDDISCGIVLLTSSQAKIFFGKGLESQVSKKEVLQQIEKGKVKIIIGTHSVIQKKVNFFNLAFVVIDEQHRFGVKQRAQLINKKGTREEFLPHLLSMSATPIPRTLALTVFGDLELSLINELPKNRKPIITKAISPSQRQKAYEFIREQIKKGRQAYVICPRIEPSLENEEEKQLSFKEKINLEVKSVKEEYEKLSKKIFPDLKIGMLHGKMKAQEKNKVISDFRDGKIDILVSTSVVEVGIDVPNANIMVIEGSEHFGLAQLYQFRGRVGRGEHQSYCFLFSNLQPKTTQQRMKALIQAKNGLQLAEIDLKLRGPGQFLGEEQTGMPDLAMKALQNPQLVKVARETAYSLIEQDPQLKNHPYLAAYLKNFKEEIHLE